MDAEIVEKLKNKGKNILIFDDDDEEVEEEQKEDSKQDFRNIFKVRNKDFSQGKNSVLCLKKLLDEKRVLNKDNNSKDIN